MTPLEFLAKVSTTLIVPKNILSYIMCSSIESDEYHKYSVYCKSLILRWDIPIVFSNTDKYFFFKLDVHNS